MPPAWNAQGTGGRPLRDDGWNITADAQLPHDQPPDGEPIAEPLGHQLQARGTTEHHLLASEEAARLLTEAEQYADKAKIRTHAGRP